MKSYINNSGKRIVISKMVNSYLVNSYLYCKKRINLIEEKKKNDDVTRYLNQLNNRAEALAKEIGKRKLAIRPS